MSVKVWEYGYCHLHQQLFQALCCKSLIRIVLWSKSIYYGQWEILGMKNASVNRQEHFGQGGRR